MRRPQAAADTEDALDGVGRLAFAAVLVAVELRGVRDRVPVVRAVHHVAYRGRELLGGERLPAQLQAVLALGDAHGVRRLVGEHRQDDHRHRVVEALEDGVLAAVRHERACLRVRQQLHLRQPLGGQHVLRHRLRELHAVHSPDEADVGALLHRAQEHVVVLLRDVLHY